MACDQKQLLWSVAEAAKALGVCSRVLRAKSAPAGPIPNVRIGRRILFSPAALQEWIGSQSGSPDSK
jgi:excisionase family DNA binding protein